jgi:probable rRNA maturation factor
MIEINNLSKTRLDKRIFSTVAKKVLSGENRRTENLSLAFVSKAEIKKLNKKFRRKNKATDVLSFGLKEKGYLGEVIICPEVVKENAKKYGNTFKIELIKIFIHGVLHLLGYDHERSKKEAIKMEKKQDFYLSKVKVK